MEVVFDEFIFLQWFRIISTFIFGYWIAGSFLNEEEKLLDVEREKTPELTRHQLDNNVSYATLQEQLN